MDLIGTAAFFTIGMIGLTTWALLMAGGVELLYRLTHKADR